MPTCSRCGEHKQRLAHNKTFCRKCSNTVHQPSSSEDHVEFQKDVVNYFEEPVVETYIRLMQSIIALETALEHKQETMRQLIKQNPELEKEVNKYFKQLS